MTERIALFPLGHVLLPGAALPLHIFEPRYQAMIADLLASTPPAFGVLSIHRGTETSEDVAFAAVGTMAEIVNRRPYPDGTSDLLTIGSRRFQVREILRSGRPYLRAEVEWLAETVGAATPELVAAARALFERYVEVVRTLSGERIDVILPAEPVPASYQLARAHAADPRGSPESAGRADRCPSVARRTGADATRDHPASTDPDRADRPPRALDQSGGELTGRELASQPVTPTPGCSVGCGCAADSVRPRSSRVVKATRRP